MIWFNCKQCGKRHGRAEHLYGTLVFCECGHGNRVPAASTAPAPDPLEAQAVPPARSRAPAPARADDDEDRRRPRQEWQPEPPGPPPARRPREARRVNANFCLAHDETPTAGTCAACRLPFCAACLVTLQGQTLCGPCKNFRIAGMGRPARVLPQATVGLVVALVSAPVAFLLGLFAIGMQSADETATARAVAVCLIGLLLPAGGLVVSGLALREIETKAQAGGRALALSGAVTGLVGVLWSVALAGMIVGKRLFG